MLDVASELTKVKAIVLDTQFNGEIKGLEYFTALETFTANAGTVANTTLDFSENTKLVKLTVTKAADLAEIELPKPEITKVGNEEKEVYHLTTLDLEGTKLTKLDLSKQDNLFKKGVNAEITVKNNKILKEVTLKSATSAAQAELKTLDLSNNALETVNLDNYKFESTGGFKLNDNHIAALDLRKTTATTNSTLGNQTLYVYEKAANVNLKDAFFDLDVDFVTPSGTAFDSETGVLTLAKNGNTSYKYDTKGANLSDAKLNVTVTRANPMNRLYNPNSGEHFYTADIKEKEALVALGWQDEGYGWVAPQTAQNNDKPVYRLYNPNAGDHHYTIDANEVKTLVSFGWKDEGKGWYSDENGKQVAVYRQYNPFANGAGAHNYTVSKAENDHLVSLGWTPEGTAWYGLK